MAEVERELERLAGLPASRLRVEWQRYFRSEAPEQLSRDLLLRAVAYKVQEQRFGSLTRTDKNMLAGLAGDMAVGSASDSVRREARPLLRPGVRLMRHWRGETHTVVVLEDGFDYQGGQYRSLTKIAREITGAHWSGPRFFAVAMTRKRRRASHPASATIAEQRGAHGAT